MQTQINPKALELIKHYESLHDGDLKKVGLQPKLCPTGYASIGYGHVVNDPVTNRALTGKEGLKRATELYPALTEAQADEFLKKDLRRFVAIVTALVRKEVSDEQMGALVSFAYNVGQGSFSSSTLLKLVNKGKVVEAADEFMKWTKGRVNGELVTLKGLVARRKSEQLLFSIGELKFFN